MFRFNFYVLDFVLVLIFYKYIHAMYNFWDHMFKQTVEIQMQDEENEERFAELMMELMYADKQIEKNE
jgi:hypothetical protein